LARRLRLIDAGEDIRHGLDSADFDIFRLYFCFSHSGIFLFQDFRPAVVGGSGFFGGAAFLGWIRVDGEDSWFLI